jgi:hypothetical protein
MLQRIAQAPSYQQEMFVKFLAPLMQAAGVGAGAGDSQKKARREIPNVKLTKPLPEFASIMDPATEIRPPTESNVSSVTKPQPVTTDPALERELKEFADEDEQVKLALRMRRQPGFEPGQQHSLLTASEEVTRGRLLGCVHDLLQCQAALKVSNDALEEYKRRFDDMSGAQQCLYEEYASERIKWEQEKKQQAREMEELRTQKDQAEAECKRLQEVERNSQSILRPELGHSAKEAAMAKLAEKNSREIMALQVKEKMLSRRYNAVEEENR